MRKKEDLNFHLLDSICFYAFKEETQEFQTLKQLKSNVNEENVLDRATLQEKVVFNAGHRFKTNGKKMITVTFYDFVDSEKIAAASYGQEGFIRISNIRKKNHWLREIIFIEADSEVEKEILKNQFQVNTNGVGNVQQNSSSAATSAANQSN